MSRRFLRSIQPACKPCRALGDIDWSHPLSRNLQICISFHEQGGSRVQEMVTRAYGTPSDVESHWNNARRYGSAWDVSNQEDQVLRYAASARWDFAHPPITMAVYGHYFSTPVGFSVIFSNGASGRERFRIIKASSGNGHQLQMSVRNSNDAGLSGLAFSANMTFMAAASYDGASVRYFLNGQTSTVAYTQTPNTTGDGLNVGDQPSAGNNYNGLVAGVLVYSRALSVAELQRLYISPWAMLSRYPIRTQSPVGVTGGGGGTRRPVSLIT